jgi:hypothetical protein
VRYAEGKDLMPPYTQLIPIEEADRLFRERIDELIDHLWVVFRDAPWDHQPPQPEFKPGVHPTNWQIEICSTAPINGKFQTSRDVGLGAAAFVLEQRRR